jgi:Bacterial extracellular solute-binding proteins, family 5 Middle
MAAGNGVLLASLEPSRPIEERIAALPGKVATFLAHFGELGDEPALNTDPGGYQIEFATCAKLLNYPDKPPPEGWHLHPEIAAAMPTLSPDRRTYRFTIRPGYRFSPPSNEPVTAETFRYSIERALSPKLAENPVGLVPPGPEFIDDIEGERAFRAGRARHISGLQASGRTLSITLTNASPDFLHGLALPFFCPVPRGTAFVFGAQRQWRDNGEGYDVSTGPYYLATFSGEGLFHPQAQSELPRTSLARLRRDRHQGEGRRERGSRSHRERGIGRHHEHVRSGTGSRWLDRPTLGHGKLRGAS